MGAPNVGKSSLVNALAGYERSIVAPTPGTTRDVVTTNIAIDGWPIELADTAGLREATEALEGEGIDRARSAGQSSDLVLWVLDAAASPVLPSSSLAHVVLLVNKIDLPSAWNLQDVAGATHVSALRGEGLPSSASKYRTGSSPTRRRPALQFHLHRHFRTASKRLIGIASPAASKTLVPRCRPWELVAKVPDKKHDLASTGSLY